MSLKDYTKKVLLKTNTKEEVMKKEVYLYDHDKQKKLVRSRNSFGKNVIESLSTRIGGGYVLLDDNVSFTSLDSNEDEDSAAEILATFTKMDSES